jgi:hypothetical protein
MNLVPDPSQGVPPGGVVVPRNGCWYRTTLKKKVLLWSLPSQIQLPAVFDYFCSNQTLL